MSSIGAPNGVDRTRRFRYEKKNQCCGFRKKLCPYRQVADPVDDKHLQTRDGKGYAIGDYKVTFGNAG